MTTKPSPVIAIHGGAGSLTYSGIDPALASAQHAAVHEALQRILTHALHGLAAAGSALDAVSVAVDLLEESPLFNAGYGAAFTSTETHELDAAIMDGATLRAGAVGAVSRIRRPLRAARAVMEHSDHVLMVAGGAEAFARQLGLEMVAPDFFSTEHRRTQLRLAQAGDLTKLSDDGAAIVFRSAGGVPGPIDERSKLGTVGAVALDAHGNLAAATSTGGITNKRPGRVGDSPLIGAGTYADNRAAAVSCTGTGEVFIRCAGAHDVCARMVYGGRTLQGAALEVITEALAGAGGRGGLIAVDARGNVAMPFNTESMYRGVARVGEAPQTAIFR